MIKNQKILIVDNEASLCSSLKTMLCSQNYEVQTCCNGNEALNHLNKDVFDLIILELDGFQEIKTIMNQKTDTPVIVLAGNASIKSAVKALKMGAKDYLKRPFEPEELYTAVRNILKQKALEKKLKQSDKKYESLVNFLPQGIEITDLDGKIIVSNPAHHKIQGYPPNGLIGKYIWELIAEEADRRKAEEYYKFLIREQPEPELYFTVDKTKDGRIIHTQIDWDYIKNSNGELAGIISIINDITERKEAEQKLLESESRANAMLHAIPDMMFRMNRQGLFLDYRADRSDLYDQASPTLVGKLNRDVTPPEFADLIDRQIRTTLKTGTLQTFEYQLPILNKGVRDYEARMVSSGTDEVTAIVRDITERKEVDIELKRIRDELEKRVEERTRDLKEAHGQLLHSEKLAAIGQLSATIAHEFNNPLYGVMSVIESVKRTSPLGEEDAELIDIALVECKRMKDLIRNLQFYNKPTSGNVIPFDIHATIDSLLLLSKKEHIIKGAIVLTDYAKDMPMIKGVGDQIKQVILNLLKNAAYACKGDGTITIITEVVSKKDISIKIQDNGTGIPFEHLDKIFYPFFTTKPKTKGSGLGLSVSHGIIKEHSGRIDVKSEPGRGSTFTILLPIEGGKSA